MQSRVEAGTQKPTGGNAASPPMESGDESVTSYLHDHKISVIVYNIEKSGV
jgi:hypothetical protein